MISSNHSLIVRERQLRRRVARIGSNGHRTCLQLGSRLVGKAPPSKKAIVNNAPSLLIEPWTPPNELLAQTDYVPCPPSPTAFPRLPDAKFRVSYTMGIKQGSKSDDKSSSCMRSSSVCFQEEVTVVEIPCRNDYDEETRESIWSSDEEIKRNKKRNMHEFVNETYYSPKHKTRSWWICREEEDMVVYNGELIHPCTFLKLTGSDVPFLWFTKLRAKHYAANKMKAPERKKLILQEPLQI